MDWITQISDSLTDVLNNARQPFQKVPALPLQAEASQRKGLSATDIASRIIERLPDAGIPTGPNPDGTKNVVNDFVKIISEEIVNAIKRDSLVLLTIPTGSIKITATGGNVGGPVESTGQNWNFPEMKGVVQ
jgi:ABC-type Fe2+-enterobactin transport system substrate-binding protein